MAVKLRNDTHHLNIFAKERKSKIVYARIEFLKQPLLCSGYETNIIIK